MSDHTSITPPGRRELYAVIPTLGDRDTILTLLLASLQQDRVTPIVVWTAAGPPPSSITDLPGVHHVTDRLPRNIHRWWNHGLAFAGHLAGGRSHAIAVLNDDLLLPPAFVSTLATALHTTQTTVAYPDQLDHLDPGTVEVRHTPHQDRRKRMTGYAFCLAGEDLIRADERFEWWFGDDDIERRALAERGTVRVGGLRVNHLHPNGHMDPELEQAIVRDRARFTGKWGRL